MRTAAYLIKKLLSASVTLAIISLLIFGVFQLLPGNPATIILGVDADPLQVQALSEELGLDAPPLQRYARWVAGLFSGDLGRSVRYQVPVIELIRQSLPVTASLAALSLLVTVALSVPVSIYLAKNNNKKLPTFISALMQVGIAVPSFWLAILLVMVFAVVLRWLPSGDFVPFSQSVSGALRSLILPAAAISIGTTAVVIRYLKNTMLDQLSMDYVRTARSKGLGKNKVLYRHVLKNALLPAITMLGMIAVDVLGGSIIVENVFNLPGIGRLIISGVGNRDFPLVQGLVFYLALTVVVVNFVVDLLYAAVDPRIRLK
ncbi:peptide/nickel transport system permease protein [Sporobacter termitidis DSM 10068]|uniref:Peptide/nickel transport system permease protein n=1 Tax=Sporobacter termitidis DSM 10068 TaxID=1123282 RepID=A0A1M5XAP0_9FIRM|nr:ABC transporter permease [Sporobacter termitidis]SHH96935.1 peptide/nickel transport system permease protein [Sporobacter termitidis DSM 10068]